MSIFAAAETSADFNVSLPLSPSKRSLTNKIDYTLKVDDIVGPPKPAFSHSIRNPLEPEYHLPSSQPRSATPPRFLRDTLDLSDLPGARASSSLSRTWSRMNDASDIPGTQPRSRTRTRKDHLDCLDVTDIIRTTFKSSRVTNPLSPRYQYGGTSKLTTLVDYTDASGLKHRSRLAKTESSVVPATTTDIGGVQQQPHQIMGEIEGAHARIKFTKSSSTPGPSCLRTDDLVRPQRSQKTSHRKTHENYALNTQDIPGAQADTVIRHMKSDRCTDPLNPAYVLLADPNAGMYHINRKPFGLDKHDRLALRVTSTGGAHASASASVAAAAAAVPSTTTAATVAALVESSRGAATGAVGPVVAAAAAAAAFSPTQEHQQAAAAASSSSTTAAAAAAAPLGHSQSAQHLVALSHSSSSASIGSRAATSATAGRSKDPELQAAEPGGRGVGGMYPTSDPSMATSSATRLSFTQQLKMQDKLKQRKHVVTTPSFNPFQTAKPEERPVSAVDRIKSGWQDLMPMPPKEMLTRPLTPVGLHSTESSPALRPFTTASTSFSVFSVLPPERATPRTATQFFSKDGPPFPAEKEFLSGGQRSTSQTTMKWWSDRAMESRAPTVQSVAQRRKTERERAREIAAVEALR